MIHTQLKTDSLCIIDHALKEQEKQRYSTIE